MFTWTNQIDSALGVAAALRKRDTYFQDVISVALVWPVAVLHLNALWLYKLSPYAYGTWCLLVSYVCVCEYIHTLLIFIYVLYVFIWLFIYLFLRPIYWFGTCGVFDDCQYIGVWCGGRVGVYEGMGGFWAWSVEKPSCDTNSNCCAPRIGWWYNLRPLYV